jgi:serine/threonine-protein kinase
MEYIRGVTLDTLLQRNGRLSPERVGRLVGQLCEVLQAAHSEGIIHRDLKPANLMVVDPDTPYEKIKVMDFGLAKLLGPKAYRKAADSTPEFAVGTPGYMCPEQARGDDMDQRGDLYSVGVIIFELLSGRLPFTGRSTMDTLLAHATEAPPTFADVGASDWVSAAVESLVRDCLAKQPAQRPPHARDLAERYDAALAQSQEAMPVVVPAELPPPGPHAGPEPNVVTPADAGEDDPQAVVHHLDAWMPETIASFKLRGFVEDVGGEVVESVPGMIKVRLGGHGSMYAPAHRLSWLGLGRRTGIIDMELRLHRADPNRDSLLRITVLMRSPHQAYADKNWRDRCSQIYCDLRGYLMGQPS